MPTKVTKKFTAWSHSRLKEYEDCPLKAKIDHLDKIKEPKGPALLNGQRVHKEAEDYVSGRLKKLPASLKLFAAEFKALQKISKRVALEGELAFDKTWRRCDWFAPETWLRLKMDAYYVDSDRLILVDYKTGKVHPENMEQLDLYAVVGFLIHPEVSVVDAQLWYLDQGEVNARSYTLKEAGRLQKIWTKRPAKLLADSTFKPRPGSGCRWCWYSQGCRAKGGPGICKF